ncbi:MAG: helix-turn-helix domain-containing protein [Bacillota bacterium]
MSDQVRKGWGREFFQAPNEIFDRRDINVYAKAGYIYLCRRADDDSQVFPTYAHIAEDVGVSQRTVRRAIDALIAAGLLLKEARYDRRGLQTSNLYTLIRPSNPELVIRYYTEEFGASERQVVMTMLSVQAQLDKGAVINNYQAYFEKALLELLQEQRLRSYFTARESDAAASLS